MNHQLNDYTEILLRFDRIGISEYANANARPEKSPIEMLREFKHISGNIWSKLTREEHRNRASFLLRIREFEKTTGITL